MELLTNNEIVEQMLAHGDMVKIVLSHYPKHFEHYDDIYQYTYLKLLEYDNEKLNHAWQNKHGYALINAIVRFSISPTSEFWRTYNKFSFRAMPLTEEHYNIAYDEG